MKSIIYIFWLVFLLLPVLLPAQPADWQSLAKGIPGLDERRLRCLEQSYTVEEVEPGILKMTHQQTGMVRYVDISEHRFNFNNPPPDVQVIDLINADTTLYNWKYKRQQNTLLVGGALGYPLVIGDLNSNGKLDFAGEYKIPINSEYAEAAIIELQEDTIFTLQKTFPEGLFIPLAITDTDIDGLTELNIRGGQNFDNYESSHSDSLPNILNFSHRMWDFGNQVGSETFTDLDNDLYTDILYVGTDSMFQCCHQIFVAEYDTLFNNFQRRFGMIPSPDWRVSGYSVGDFDEDGYTEFVTGSVLGDVYLIENTGDDSYQQTFYDTLSTPNAYMTNTTNDIDGNGKREFFVGGSAFYNGVPASRIYWFESTGDNTYQKVRSFFLLGTDVFGFAELFINDVNSDGVEDLIFSFSFSVVMLIWNKTAEQFDIFYYDYWENLYQEIHSVNLYDVFYQGYPDLFVSVKDVINPPRIKSFFYRFNPITGIEIPMFPPESFHLSQNYPNPFNNSTQINFNLPKREKISLKIYDITGKEVITLINHINYSPGKYSVSWIAKNQNGKEVSSGLYFYVLTGIDPSTSLRQGFREVKKMLLIK